MSGDHAKREIVTGDKPASSGRTLSRDSGHKNKEESSSSTKSLRRGDKKKTMKKVVYYETDSSSPSTSSSESSVASKRHERKKYSKMPLRYPRISKGAPLLSVPLGKPPYFGSEDYCMWSDKMRHHLTSLHESIWDIVEFGAQVPQVWDKDYDSDEATQIRHFNSQATSILLASLCREEYNKLQGLKTAKEIWDILKTAHEGDEVTKITKREMIEGELGQFVLNEGEEPQAMYNRLKTMVNQVRNLGSTKWDDHEMVKVILGSLVFHNPTQVQLIRGDPRYKLMSPEEVIGKCVSFELMIKDSKHIVNLEQGATSTPEVQPVAFKAMEEDKRESTPSRLPIDASKLDNEEMALIIKSFRQILKQRRGRTINPAPKGCATNVVSPVISLLNVQCLVKVTGAMTRRGRRKKRRGTTRRRVAMPTYVGNGTPMRAPPTPPLTRTPPTLPSTRASSSPNVGHKCFMAKDGKKKKVHSRATPKYITSSDEGSSSENEDGLLTLFANLSMEQKEKLNELIEVIHEKDEILDNQEDFLIKENKKHVKLKNAYAQEVEKCENLSKELSICHDSISSLRDEDASLVSKVKDLNVCNDSVSCLKDENVKLNAKIEELNACKPSTSTIDHVSICTRCIDVNVKVMDDHLAMIKQQNDHIAKLTAKIAEHELENEKFKFARIRSIMGDALPLRMSLVSNRKAMSSLMPLRNCLTL
jgi:hypothetical protein